MSSPDINKYRSFLDRCDLTDEQTVETIHAVWRIVEGFAYHAFGLDPVQQITALSSRESALNKAPVLDFEKTPNPNNSLTDTFRLTARKRGRRKK